MAQELGPVALDDVSRAASTCDTRTRGHEISEVLPLSAKEGWTWPR